MSEQIHWTNDLRTFRCPCRCRRPACLWLPVATSRIQNEALEMSESQYIKSLTVRHFKGLANFSLDGIGGFNILFGANDVGKTSVLEALFLVTGCTNLGLPVRVHNYRSHLVQSVDDFANFFFRLDTDLPIQLTASSTSPMECRTLTISTPQIDAPDEVALQQVRSTSHATVVQSDGDSVPAPMSSTMSPMPRVLRYEAKMVHPTGRYEFTGDLSMRSPTDFDLPPLPDYARRMVIPARIIMPGLGYEVSAIAELIVRKRDYELLEILRAVSPGAQRITVDAAKAYVDIGLDRMLPLKYVWRRDDPYRQYPIPLHPLGTSGFSWLTRLKTVFIIQRYDRFWKL